MSLELLKIPSAKSKDKFYIAKMRKTKEESLSMTS